MKNDIKEVGMDDTAKAVDQRRMESSTHVLETSAVVPMSQREIKRQKVAARRQRTKPW